MSNDNGIVYSLVLSPTQLDPLLEGVRDSNLKFSLAFGVGIHHAGLHEKDRKLVEELFVNQKIQVLNSHTHNMKIKLHLHVL